MAKRQDFLAALLLPTAKQQLLLFFQNSFQAKNCNQLQILIASVSTIVLSLALL
jgi:hypothetical protein